MIIENLFNLFLLFLSNNSIFLFSLDLYYDLLLFQFSMKLISNLIVFNWLFDKWVILFIFQSIHYSPPTITSQQNTLFTAISSVETTLLAIIFSVSLFVINLSSSAYSHSLVKYFLYNRKTAITFFFSIITIFSCSIFLYFNIIHPISLTFELVFFLITIFLFINYCLDIINIANIEGLSNFLEVKLQTSIKEKDDVKVKVIIDDIGNISSRLINKKQSDDALFFFKKLIDIKYFIQDLKSSDDIQVKYLSLIWDQISTICRLLIENEDPHRFTFIKIILSNILQDPIVRSNSPKFIELNMIETNCNFFIKFEMNFLYSILCNIITLDDFKLFQTVIHKCSIYLLDSPLSLKIKIENDIFQQKISNPSSYDLNSEICLLYNKIIKNLHEMVYHNFLLITKLLPLFNEFETRISRKKDCDSHIGSSSTQYLDLINLFIILNLHQIFFQIGAFILYTQKRNLNFDAQNYIKELWFHNQPDDADATILNHTPICFDSTWITSLLIYGGTGNKYWTKQSSLRFGTDHFHGSEQYHYIYYFIILCNCLKKDKKELSIPQLDLFNLDKEGRDILNERISLYSYELKQSMEFYRKYNLKWDDWRFFFDEYYTNLFDVTNYWLLKNYNKYLNERQKYSKTEDLDGKMSAIVNIT